MNRDPEKETYVNEKRFFVLNTDCTIIVSLAEMRHVVCVTRMAVRDVYDMTWRIPRAICAIHCWDARDKVSWALLQVSFQSHRSLFQIRRTLTYGSTRKYVTQLTWHDMTHSHVMSWPWPREYVTHMTWHDPFPRHVNDASFPCARRTLHIPMCMFVDMTCHSHVRDIAYSHVHVCHALWCT